MRVLFTSLLLFNCQVSNQDLLHAVVALYDHCLPEITPEVLYATVCGKWAKTLILLRDLQGMVLRSCQRPFKLELLGRGSDLHQNSSNSITTKLNEQVTRRNILIIVGNITLMFLPNLPKLN